MGYSSLVDYIKISPNSTNPREDDVDTITIHHMAGNITVEECGAVFAPKSRRASSNYGIDNTGRVGLYVDENNRSWASSSPANDHRAITIELANDQTGGDWHVSDLVIEKCIELCVDICKRHNIQKINFTGDARGNLTMHRYFANTGCPGPYLGSKFPYIAAQINERLNNKEDLTLSQYTELKGIIEQQSKKIELLSSELGGLKSAVKLIEDYAGIKYNYVDDYMPEFARDTIRKLLEAGVIESELKLSYDDLRVYTILDRLNVIDNAKEYNTVSEVPEYGRDVVQKLVDADVIRGDGSGLGITEQTVKLLAYLDRMKLLNV